MSLINDGLILLISVIHLIVVIFILVAPFSNSNYLISLHIIIVPFIVLHWVLNNNTCCLTMAEKYIREKNAGQSGQSGQSVKDDDCFTYKLVAPIYDFNKNNETFSILIYILTIGLWSVSVYNLINKIKSGEILSINDLAEI